jgi:A/G-specific adenine glycosylase
MIDHLQHKSDFRKKLLLWNQLENDRQMPWKQEPDPYKIWLSEIILQQTRVEQGWSYYEAFILQYPNIHSLAQAPEEDVFKLWEGLGYYSRCRNLIYTARHISASLRGVFPNTYEELLNLKGVGPYTAAAIGSFAFNLPNAVVDGNVIRVLARFFGLDFSGQDSNGKKWFQQLAQELLDKKNPATYNQAIMDFGAVICKPKAALCNSCPLASNCYAYQNNKVFSLPIRSKAKPKKERWFYYFIAEYKQEVLVRKRVENDIWQQLHEFLCIETSLEKNMEAVLELFENHFFSHPQFSIQSCSEVMKHTLTHQQIYLRFVHLKLNKKLMMDGFTYHKIGQLNQIAFPKAIINFLENYKWR